MVKDIDTVVDSLLPKTPDMMMQGYFNFMKDGYELILKNCDDKERVILVDTPADYLNYCGYDLFNENLQTTDYLKKIAASFRTRMLPMKALVISAQTVDSGLFRLLELREDKDWPTNRRMIEELIWYYIEPDYRPSCKRDIILDIPKLPPLNEAELTCVRVGPDKELKRISVLTSSAQDLLDTYTQIKWRGHVFVLPDKQENIGAFQRKAHEAAIRALEGKPFEMKLNRLAGDLINFHDQ